MKHNQRVTALRQIERLNNMRLASRRDLEDFCLKNKTYLDDMLSELIAMLSPPAKRKKPKYWSDLRPQDVERITKKLRYKSNPYVQLLQMGFVGQELGSVGAEIKEHPRRSYRIRGHGSSWAPKEGTPLTRLEDKRRSLVISFKNDRTRAITKYEFIPDLHPDDAEWTSDDTSEIHVVADRHVITLNKILPSNRILAARLYMEDLEIPVCVYHCAVLRHPRSGPNVVQTCYIGRAVLSRNGGIWISEKAKTPTTAFKDAKAAWTRAMSAIIYTEEKE